MEGLKQTKGAGVIGLTTALTLAPYGRWKITVVAKHMPGDYDIEYASPWAGADYLPYVQNLLRNILLSILNFQPLIVLGNPGRSWPNLSVIHGRSCKGSHPTSLRRVYTFKVRISY